MIELLMRQERFMELEYKKTLVCELAESLSYKVRQEIRNRRLRLGYTQKDLASKIGTKYQVILQYEKGTRRISIKKLYALAEALSTSARDLVSTVSKRYFENEEEEILNLVRRHKEIKDQELREIFYLLTKFIRISEERSGKAVKIEVAKGLVKAGVSAHVISRTTNLSIGEYEEKKISIPYKVGQRIKEWRLRREYTQEDLANKVGITNQRIYEYEQGRAAVSLEMLDEIAKVLSISIIDLLPESTEDENSEVGLSNLIEEYKKIESQELRDVLIKSLFEGIRICREKVREAKKIEVAKSLVKEGISVDIILQTTGHKF
ncbi:putative transcriptional regulator [Trichonephila clavata]|uniref:Putative transcriptional regulator n=1 Tax=Trichonephila clavata TaxID=2740835 RepID=A0A8X6G7U1_TRICU|nr:putative transcriptional regulator [Trichonephila clavata]GFR28362.1 putative transcriptional regulator [Trichonephila clavata]